MNSVFKVKSFFLRNKHICWGRFFKKRKAIGLEKSSISSKKNFVLERAWFGSICSENTIIKLSFEIEIVFFKKQTFLLGLIFQKKEGYRLRKIVEIFKKNVLLDRAWFGSICSENTIIELDFEIEVVFSKKKILLLGSIFQKKEGYSLEKLSISSKKICSRKSLFGPICSENTIIKLSFEIEIVFFKKQILLLGSIFQKKES